MRVAEERGQAPAPQAPARMGWVLSAMGAPSRSNVAVQRLAGLVYDDRRPAAAVTYERGWFWLHADHCEQFEVDGAPYSLLLRRGMRSDLASIPRAVWWLMAPFELTVEAALLHDRLYEAQGLLAAEECAPAPGVLTRKQCDAAFLGVMAERGVDRVRRRLAYQAVRAFGWASWRGTGRDRAPG